MCILPNRLTFSEILLQYIVEESMRNIRRNRKDGIMTLYVSDLDGTLLSSSKKLPLRAADMLNDLIENGAAFTYCTARRIQSSEPLMKDVKLNIPVILMNGVFIYDTQKKEYIQKNLFSGRQCALLREAAMRLNESPMVYSFINGGLRNSYFEGEKSLASYLSDHRADPTLRPVHSLDEMFEGESFYALFINPVNKDALDEIFTKENGFSHVYYADVYHKGEYWYEVFSASAGKGNAVLQLKRLVGADEVVCFGDNGNDLPMFRVSDRCYAVENAVEEVKREADGVILSNDSLGVPRFLERELFTRYDYVRPESKIDEARFAEAVRAALSREQSTIGTLNEKAVHYALKYYYCGADGIEPRIGGFYADGAGEDGLYEIQTGSFSRLNKKLSCMLRACHVTVVYPCSRIVHTVSIDERTGEVLSSSKRTERSFSRFFLELYRIKGFLTNPNLTVCAALLEVEQKLYFKDGRKIRRKGMRKEKTPMRYLEEIRLDSAADYLRFLPEELPEVFTKKETAALCKSTDASLLLEILEFTGAVRRVGKRGGAILYERCLNTQSCRLQKSP